MKAVTIKKKENKKIIVFVVVIFRELFSKLSDTPYLESDLFSLPFS